MEVRRVVVTAYKITMMIGDRLYFASVTTVIFNLILPTYN